MSQSSTTLPSQAPVSTAATLAATPAAALVSRTLLTSAKERMKELMACIPEGGVEELSDVVDWGKRFADLLVRRLAPLSPPRR
jgi:hypothetical protein